MVRRGKPAVIDELTPDASTREYYRIGWESGTAIACVYHDPFIATEQSFMNATALFSAAGLPVARVIDYDEELGVIVQEDFGDTILRDFISDANQETRERYLSDAIDIIARIQAATDLAREMDSIASHLSFDFEKLSWELDFFFEHYFTTLRRSPLDDTTATALRNELHSVARELESKATVLTHRDFHAANLMVAPDGSLKIIDHQDARMGSPAYDLVSLLLDRVTEAPSSNWLAEKRRTLLEKRAALGLPMLDEAEFADEFRLQTIQRCLKAIGTFSYQSAVRGKTHFLPFIKPMFEIVLRAAESLNRFPALQGTIASEISKDQ